MWLLCTGYRTAHRACVQTSAQQCFVPALQVALLIMIMSLLLIFQGFQYMELEANLNEEGTDVYGEPGNACCCAA